MKKVKLINKNLISKVRQIGDWYMFKLPDAIQNAIDSLLILLIFIFTIGLIFGLGFLVYSFNPWLIFPYAFLTIIFFAWWVNS